MSQNFKHTRTVSDTLKIKGVLSDDATSITYIEDKEEQTVSIMDYLKAFAGELVTFGITSKEELNLADE